MPNTFHVISVESNIWVIQVNPVSNDLGEVVPLFLVFHHCFLAFPVIRFDRNALTDVLFGDSKFFFNLEFNGQTVGIPASFAMYLVSSLCFKPTKNIFYGAGHNVMDARCAVCRWRTFIKGERWPSFSLFNRPFKDPVFFPVGKYFFADMCVIKIPVFFVFHFLGDIFENLFTKIFTVSIVDQTNPIKINFLVFFFRVKIIMFDDRVAVP